MGKRRHKPSRHAPPTSNPRSEEPAASAPVAPTTPPDSEKPGAIPAVATPPAQTRETAGDSPAPAPSPAGPVLAVGGATAAADRSATPPPEPSGPTSLTGCVLRAGWLLAGPAALFVCLGVIVAHGEPVGSAADVVFLAVLALLLWARRREEQAGFVDREAVPGGDFRTFCRYVPAAALMALAAAHLVVAVLRR